MLVEGFGFGAWGLGVEGQLGEMHHELDGAGGRDPGIC